MTIAEGAVRKLDAHVWEREANEHYVEPEWCSERLFDEEEFIGAIWDPACGFGRIAESARARKFLVAATDIVDRGYKHFDGAHDFLTHDGVISNTNVITNPPFNIADRFALHALKFLPAKVAIIFPTARLNAAHWIQGTPLRRVWLMTPRPSMPPGHVIARGEKPGGGKMDYCWLVWERGYSAEPELRWLRRDKTAA